MLLKSSWNMVLHPGGQKVSPSSTQSPSIVTGGFTLKQHISSWLSEEAVCCLGVLCLDRAEIWHQARLIAGDNGPVCQLTALGGRVRAEIELQQGWDSAAWLWHTGGRHRAYVGKVHSQNSEVRRFSLSPRINSILTKVKLSSGASDALKQKKNSRFIST